MWLTFMAGSGPVLAFSEVLSDNKEMAAVTFEMRVGVIALLTIFGNGRFLATAARRFSWKPDS